MTVYNEIFTSFIFSHVEQIPKQRRVLKVLIELIAMSTGATESTLLQIKTARFLYFVYVSLRVLVTVVANLSPKISLFRKNPMKVVCVVFNGGHGARWVCKETTKTHV